MTNDGKEWAALDIRHETIKVRFSDDYDLEIKNTRNGVILPMDYLSGNAKELMPWISPDIIKSDMVDGENVVYVLGNVYNPTIAKRLGHDGYDHKFNHCFEVAGAKRKMTAQEFVDSVKANQKVPANVVFAMQSA